MVKEIRLEELPILFVLPGMERNSKSILANMRETAERKRIILLSPRFDPDKFSPEMYNRGNVTIRSTTGHEYTIQEDSSQFTFKKFIGIFNFSDNSSTSGFISANFSLRSDFSRRCSILT